MSNHVPGIPRLRKHKARDLTKPPTEREMERLARIAERWIDLKPAIADAAIHLLEVIGDSYAGPVTVPAKRLAARVSRRRRPACIRTRHLCVSNPHGGIGDGGWDNLIRAIEDTAVVA